MRTNTSLTRAGTFEKVVLPETLSVPDIAPKDLVKMRSLIPVINDTFDVDPEGAQERWNDMIEKIDQVHSAIIMEGLIDDFQMNWQYGRLLHNTGKLADAEYYLAQASILERDNPKVLARLTEFYLDRHKECPNCGHLEEAQAALSDTQKLEQSEYVDRLAGKVNQAIQASVIQSQQVKAEAA